MTLMLSASEDKILYQGQDREHICTSFLLRSSQQDSAEGAKGPILLDFSLITVALLTHGNFACVCLLILIEEFWGQRVRGPGKVYSVNTQLAPDLSRDFQGSHPLGTFPII